MVLNIKECELLKILQNKVHQDASPPIFFLFFQSILFNHMAYNIWKIIWNSNLNIQEYIEKT